MKKFINKWFSMINKRDLVTSVTASIIVLSLIACGSSAGVLPPITVNPKVAKLLHLSTSQRTGSRIFPGDGTKPFVAAMFFQATPTPSRVQQSYDAVCNFQPGFLGSVSSGSLVPLAVAGESSSCVFFTGPLQDGKQTIFDGSLSTLVVAGKTASGAAFQCRDVDTTFSVLDNSTTRAYLDPNAHTVVVFNAMNGGLTKIPFVCTGIGSDADQVATIEAQWAKI